jgi:NADH dehydrogenase FAD-containing subunit
MVLGAGYAGLMCAVRLAGQAKKYGLRAALVNRDGQFCERLRLHERIAEPTSCPPARLPPLTQFLAGSRCAFIQGDVSEIDIESRSVRVLTGGGPRCLHYGQLVLALGSRVDTDAVPGIAEHAYTLDATGPRGQPELKRRLTALGASPRIVVVGAGATGIEVAAELKQIDGARVTLVDAGEFAGFATRRVRRHLIEAADRAGIEIRENIRVQSIAPNLLTTNAGGIAFDVSVWCGGFRGQDVVAASGLDIDAKGRVRVDPYLRALSDPAVFVAGDACIPIEWHGAPARMSAFFALATGAHVADTIVRLHAGSPARPFGFWTYGQAIAVGREAVGFATLPYDRQVGPIYRKRAAFFLRWFFVWVLVQLIAMARRYPRFPFWLGRGAHRTKTAGRYAPPGILRRRQSARQE